MTDIPRYTAHPGYVTPARRGELCFYKDLEALRKRVEELESYPICAPDCIVIDKKQIDAAWADYQKAEREYPLGMNSAMYALGAENTLKKLGIVRCEECGGSGWIPVSIVRGARSLCPNCNGHGWVVKDESNT